MRYHWSVVFIAACIALSDLGTPAARSDEPSARTLRLPTNLTAAALNPDSGDVAFVSLRNGQLWLLKSAWFDGDADARMGPVTNVENPSWVTFKRYGDRAFVVVGCFAAGPVRVFAADTLQDLRFPHNLRADAVWLSVSRDPADPLVYVAAESQGKPAVFVVNLAANELSLHPLLAFGRSPAKVAGAIVSSSGRTLYKFGDDDRRLTAWRVHPPSSPAKPPRLERLYDTPDPAAETRTQPPITLPYDSGLVDGDTLASPNATPDHASLPTPVSCIREDRPLAFGLSDQQLRLVSVSTLGLLASRPLAAELFEYQLHEREIVARTEDNDHRFGIRPVVLPQDLHVAIAQDQDTVPTGVRQLLSGERSITGCYGRASLTGGTSGPACCYATDRGGGCGEPRRPAPGSTPPREAAKKDHGTLASGTTERQNP